MRVRRARADLLHTMLNSRAATLLKWKSSPKANMLGLHLLDPLNPGARA